MSLYLSDPGQALLGVGEDPLGGGQISHGCLNTHCGHKVGIVDFLEC